MIHRDYQLIGSEIHVDMFDDRLEITSPGGMLSGSRIQELDLRHVPSMRRNEIISDIFGRLHYMDRRGSGIGRILNSYAEFAQQPQFFSTQYSFAVVLPNRSVADPAQIAIAHMETQLEGGKTQLTDQKTQLTNLKTQLSDQEAQPMGRNDTTQKDWELAYFRDILLKKHENSLHKKTIDKLLVLFGRYRFTYSFNRRNIADLFSITPNGSSDFISKCLDRGIIKKVKRDVYCFVMQEEDTLL